MGDQVSDKTTQVIWKHSLKNYTFSQKEEALPSLTEEGNYFIKN